MIRSSIRSPRGRVIVAAIGLLIGALALIAPPLTGSSVAATNGATTGDTDGEGGYSCDEKRNTEVVLGALRMVFSEHRIDQVDRFFAEDFVQHSPYVPPGGRAELKQWWASVIYAIPDVTTTITTHTVTKCSDVVTFRTVQGTIEHDLPALGIIGAGKQIQFRAADIFRVQDGKITEHWEVVDTGPFVTLAFTS